MQQEIDRQYDIGNAYFNLPLETKGDPKYRCDFAQGNYFGYRAVSKALAAIRNTVLIPCAGQ